MAKAIVPNPDVCTGCRMCEMVCSVTHEDIVNPGWSRIRIVRSGPETDLPIVCSQGNACNMECVEVCPVDCIRTVNGNAIEVVREECIGCGECEEACPLNAIHLKDGVAFKCDLCHGDPVCAKFCSAGAIRFDEGDAEAWERIRILAGGSP